MYRRFFGFTKSPFNLTPDPSFLYMSRQHRVAIESLFYGVTERKGFCLLSGEIGTGKTMMSRALMDRLDPERYATALLFNPFLTTTELMQAILAELGLATAETSANKLLETLYQFLLERAHRGQTTILILDEAQNFSPEALEAVRMISNLETASEKLVQIVLMGQPEIEKKLERHDLRQLNQRIHVRVSLGPLAAAETAEYISQRLRVAGGDRIQFAWRALSKIHRRTQGFPRLINILCDRILLAAYLEETAVITPRIVDRAYVDLQGKTALALSKPGFLAGIWRRTPRSEASVCP